jgi:hypothetical protein
VVRASEKGVRNGERRSKGKNRAVEMKEGVEFKRKKKGGEHKENSNLLTWVESWRVFVEGVQSRMDAWLNMLSAQNDTINLQTKQVRF